MNMTCLHYRCATHKVALSKVKKIRDGGVYPMDENVPEFKNEATSRTPVEH